MNMQDRIKGLYRAPFEVDSRGVYITDANGNTVADFTIGDDVFRPRGYGRTKYMEDGDALHDACEEYLLSLIPEESRTDRDTCVRLLNEAWDAGTAPLSVKSDYEQGKIKKAAEKRLRRRERNLQYYRA